MTQAQKIEIIKEKTHKLLDMIKIILNFMMMKKEIKKIII